MTSWADIERAVQARPDWKRRGRRWDGPCPVSNYGKTQCWVQPGDRGAAVVIGCQHCGGPGGLDGEGLRSHREALLGVQPSSAAAPPPRKPRSARNMDEDLPGRVWTAAEPLREARGGGGLVGLLYLSNRLGDDPPDTGSLRWAAAEDIEDFLKPRLPKGAAGCLVYRFAGDGEIETRAVQVEAVGGEGRILFGGGAKRPAVAGSKFGGARVFTARKADEDDGDPVTHVCEGPLDALALAMLERAGLMRRPETGGLVPGRIVGTLGTSGWTPEAAPGKGPVVLWAQGDKPGADAAQALSRQLAGRNRRTVFPKIEPPGSERDWADIAKTEFDERAAVSAYQRGELEDD